jgi:hypothetical protein
MKTYTLELYSGNRTIEYTIIADSYEPSIGGYYVFFTQNEESRKNTVVASFPICRTVIAKIDNQNK